MTGIGHASIAARHIINATGQESRMMRWIWTTALILVLGQAAAGCGARTALRPPTPSGDPLLPSEESGSIFGYVLGDTNALSYANVVLVGTRFGAMTDERGHFKIPRVPAGTYKLMVQEVGHGKRTMLVTVFRRRNTEVKVQMGPAKRVRPL